MLALFEKAHNNALREKRLYLRELQSQSKFTEAHKHGIIIDLIVRFAFNSRFWSKKLSIVR